MIQLSSVVLICTNKANDFVRQNDIAKRLAGGSQSARAEVARKAINKLKSTGAFVEKPFTPRRRSFLFPEVERVGQTVVTIEDLTHGYGDKALFDQQDLLIEKGERVAVIGTNGEVTVQKFLTPIQDNC